MKISLNGEHRDIPDGLTVLGLLELLQIQHQRVAVERNEEIVKKVTYADTVIADGDRIEVVSFMGGGCSRAATRDERRETRGVPLMEKKQFLKHWSLLRKDQAVRPKAVRYRHEGSTYAEDGIRITGSRKFIDSVLSRLKDLLAYECDETRLQVVYKRSSDRESGKQIASWNCYIQVHGRGGAPEKMKAKKKKTG